MPQTARTMTDRAARFCHGAGRTMTDRAARFPHGAGLTVAQLASDPHPHLARLRAREPVSWVPALQAWLVSRYDLALAVMRDPQLFTVDHPGFSTARVIGESMLSLDGPRHDRARAPFAPPFRPHAVRERFTRLIEHEIAALLEQLAPAGGAELRRQFAGPLAAAVLAAALGLSRERWQELLALYDQIVGAVSAISAGAEPSRAAREAFARLEQLAGEALAAPGVLSLAAAAGALSAAELFSNAAVILFGGIETTEGMIANALLMLLSAPEALEQVRAAPPLLERAIEESLRLEPAAAAIDRYATADCELGGVPIAAGELVRVSISAANRDPALFARPDCFDLERANLRRHLAFAHGPHVCLGVHLARLEARLALSALLERFPRLRLDPAERPTVSGLIFRKPQALRVLW
jgi:cytochrome P450